MKSLVYILIVFMTPLVSCSKNSSAGTPSTAPSNLIIKAVISTDSSGNVSFTASANNAVTYSYNFGDFDIQNGSNGIASHPYSFTGSYNVTVTAKSTGGQTVSKSITLNVIVAIRLVWFDEFDTPGSPDSTKWGYDIGTGSGGWGNNELEYYTSRQVNAIVSNGTLKIIAKKEAYNGSLYTSARMLSNNLYSFKFGRMDVRAKLPASTGTWPAIWMLGNNITTAGWPACGEIDVMEQTGSDKSTILGTLHYPSEVGQYGDGSKTSISTATSAFHVYSTLWTPTHIQLSVDSVVYYTLPNNPAFPFYQPFFIILNVAMGGNLGGTVDPAFTADHLEVDYIRVYQ